MPIVNAVIEKARQVNLDKDIALPEDASGLSKEERDTLIGKVYIKLMEIESRLLPCGLHVVGEPPTAEEAIATLVNIASLDRPEEEKKSLQRIVAESIGRDIDQIYASSDRGNLEDVQTLYDINSGVRAAVAAMVHEQINDDGRVSMKSVLSAFNFGGAKAVWTQALHELGYKNIEDDSLTTLFEYLQFCLKQVVADNELASLLRALDGEYVLPGPGGDPIRNPDVLPTGKNIHALDPQSIPTSAAVQSAKIVVDRLLERQQAENDGAYPETIATVLWGTDNIKTYGESLAQMMWFVGVKPVPDALGRMNKLELISLEELGRPRVDVVINCSGVFRDLFVNQMALLDRAVKMAAEADEPVEMNFVRKHAMAQAEEFGLTLRECGDANFLECLGFLCGECEFGGREQQLGRRTGAARYVFSAEVFLF